MSHLRGACAHCNHTTAQCDDRLCPPCQQREDRFLGRIDNLRTFAGDTGLDPALRHVMINIAEMLELIWQRP